MNTTMKSACGRVREALEHIAGGGSIIVRDASDRENEGDLVCAGAFASEETIAYMAVHGRGLICAAIEHDAARRLGLPMMTHENQDVRRTAFTVSVDASVGVTTGISAADRARTIRILADPARKACDLTRPGHVFPLVARPGGVLERVGHTEAAVDLARLAGCGNCGAICEILDDRGVPLHGRGLEDFALRERIPLVSVHDIVLYRHALGDIRIEPGEQARLPTRFGEFRVRVYRCADPGCPEIVCLEPGRPSPTDELPLVRLHSECLTGDCLGSLRCDCGAQLERALELVARNGGAVLYLRQEGRGIGIFEKINAYALQDRGRNTVEANLALGHPADKRYYGAAVAVLRGLGMTRFGLLTNNPGKIDGLAAGGFFDVSVVGLVEGINPENESYISTKIELMGHRISLPLRAGG